jgi:hypothetical protein
VAALSPYLAGKAVTPGRVLWKLDGANPAVLHQSGQAGRLGWGVEPGLDPSPAFLSYGPYWELPLKAPLRVTFKLESPALGQALRNERVAMLDVREASVGILASREVLRGDFPSDGGEREFSLDFENDPAKLKRLEFRIAWWGNQELRHESTVVAARGN